MDTLFPSTILQMLQGFAPLFGAHHFLYFRGFVLATLLLGTTRKCMTHLARTCFFVERHLSSWERFLSQAQWDLPALQQHLVKRLREHLGDQMLVFGASLAWVDTTLIAKVKGRMPGVQRWHDSSGNPDRGSHLVGHHWALAGLLGRVPLLGKPTPLCFPLLATLISGTLAPFGFVVTPEGVASPMTFWDAVCPLIAQMARMLDQAPLRVVADAYFAKAPFLTWMRRLGVHVITRMRWDAVGWDDPLPDPPGKKKRGRPRTKPRQGLQWKLATLLTAFRPDTVKVELYGKRRTLTFVTRDLGIRDVSSQKVRIVVIQAQRHPCILLSTDLTLSPGQIIQIYALRFSLEIGIREIKQHAGVGDYQCTSLTAMTRFVGLSVLSFSLWRLALWKDREAPWLSQEPPMTSPLSMTRASRALRRFLLEGVFRKFAPTADFENSDDLSEALAGVIV